MSWTGLIHDGLKLLAVFLLVLLNAFFVAAELALVRIRDTQLEALVAKGNRRAKMARHIVNHIDAYISTTQFGITLAPGSYYRPGGEQCAWVRMNTAHAGDPRAVRFFEHMGNGGSAAHDVRDAR